MTPGVGVEGVNSDSGFLPESSRSRLWWPGVDSNQFQSRPIFKDIIRHKNAFLFELDLSLKVCHGLSWLKMHFFKTMLGTHARTFNKTMDFLLDFVTEFLFWKILPGVKSQESNPRSRIQIRLRSRLRSQLLWTGVGVGVDSENSRSHPSLVQLFCLCSQQ